ncbi:MAG: hypothetical protein V4714_10900 [Bacteroidota bacterium]
MKTLLSLALILIAFTVNAGSVSSTSHAPTFKSATSARYTAKGKIKARKQKALFNGKKLMSVKRQSKGKNQHGYSRQSQKKLFLY